MNAPGIIATGSALALVALGLVLRAGMADVSAAFLWTHAAWLTTGIAGLVVLQHVKFHAVCQRVPLLFGVSVAAGLLLPVFFRGHAGLRPAHLLAPGLLLFLATWRGDEARRTPRVACELSAAWLVAIAVAVVPADFSGVLLLLLTGLVLLVARGYFQTALLGAAAVIAGFALFVARDQHRLVRILALLAPATGGPHSHPACHFAVEAGGLTGVGFGNGTHLTGCPGAARTFLAAHLCEEFGRVGLYAVILLLLALTGAGLVAALRASDRRACAAGIGIAAWITIQSILHIAVLFEELPLKPVSLPLAGAEGPELVLQLASVGLLPGLARGGKRNGAMG